MFHFFIILNVCTQLLGVLSSGVDTLFDRDLLDNALDPELCQQQLRTMRTFEFYDASFRVPQSISKGNRMGMGNFHQCLGIAQDVEGDVIEGKYCLVNAQLRNSNFPVLKGKSWLENIQWVELDINSTNVFHEHKNALAVAGESGHKIKRIGDKTDISQMEFSLAVCIPKTCTVENALIPVENNIDYVTEVCRLPGDKLMAPADYAAIVIFSIIGILTILSTAYDLRHRILLKKDPGEASKLLRCCSVYTNTKTLMTFRGNSNAIDCLDGIRALSTMWIVIFHASYMYLTKYTINVADYFPWLYSRKGLWITTGLLAVDTFLTLSGVLLVYTSVKKMKQMQLLKKLHVFYLNRLLRMFPLLACAVLLQASVFHHVSDGVGWHELMAVGVLDCREYWWSALLHIQNIVNPLQTCLQQTWYLSVDMQLHILSPLILFWVLGSRRAAWGGLALGAGGGIIASSVYVFLRDFTIGNNYDFYYYRNPLARCSPFLLGMILGYILHVYREKKLKISAWFIGLGYIVSFAVGAFCINSDYEDRKVTQTELGIELHRVFVRPLWGAYVGWIIFACHQGYGGPINWFLSLTIWKFMARISYAMFLLHIPVLTTITASTVVPIYYKMENLWLMLAYAMVYTVITSIAACVLVEAPCTTLQNMLLTYLMPTIKSTATKTIAPTPTAPEDIESRHTQA